MTTLTPPDWVEAREYQQAAIDAWLNANGQGILHMATGTGKTVTSLLAASTAAERLEGELALIIAVPYQHLVDQWASDLEDFGVTPIRAYESRTQWSEALQGQVLEFNHGAGEGFVVITTHTTFASEPFRRMVDRLSRREVMLIADEVHHLGAPHLREALPRSVPLRLGLSATPQRFYDDEGTEDLLEYFGGIPYEYPLERAIEAGALCEYYYIPHVVELTDDEADDYISLSKQIARLIGKSGGVSAGDFEGNTELKFTLFERARLVGTAANKLARLVTLMQQQDPIQDTLVYCGDGTVEGAVNERTRRHVDATTTTLRNDLGLRVERFTADENRAERERLLQQFEAGDLQALVAIRCLDEGVDVPSTRTAYMLASSANPRQFVQRRGRILRNHPGKQVATIHDFVVAPPDAVQEADEESDRFRAERSLVQRELERVDLFAGAARNHPDADITGVPTSTGSIGDLRRAFNLRQM